MVKNKNRRAQIGIEYMIVVGFVSLAIMSILAFAFLYSSQIKDKIRLNQVESFATQLVNSAESVFFAGEPSKTTIKLYLPDGVEEITIASDSVIIRTNVAAGGSNVRGFSSKVPLNGSIAVGEGLKKLVLEAKSDHVQITHVT
jgi:hypothetical protein